MTAYVGIDPGLDGGIAWIGKFIGAFPMPTINMGTKRMVDMHSVRALLTEIGPVDLVMLEDVNAGAVKSVTSAFAFGRGYGRLEGLLHALERPYDYVSSPVWTRAIGITKGAGKAEHIAVARRLFPQFDNLRDGQADALLIAEYARRLHTGRVAA